MKRLATASLALLAIFFLAIATERRAYAYVNPGEGLLALQSLASAAAAGAYLLRRRIGRLFQRTPAAATDSTAVKLAPRTAAPTVLAENKTRKVA